MKGVVSAGLRPHVFVRPGCEAEPRARAGWEHGPQAPARALRPLQAGLERRLANAKRKALQLEELLPTRVISEDQREVLRLLCRAHELEQENTELRAGKLRRRHLLCRKDLVIQRHHQHRRLCKQLIHDLWQLIRGEPPRPGPRTGRWAPHARTRTRSRSPGHRRGPPSAFTQPCPRPCPPSLSPGPVPRPCPPAPSPALSLAPVSRALSPALSPALYPALSPNPCPLALSPALSPAPGPGCETLHNAREGQAQCQKSTQMHTRGTDHPWGSAGSPVSGKSSFIRLEYLPSNFPKKKTLSSPK